MKTLKSDDIIYHIKKSKIEFILIGDLKDKYIVASIFEIIENGFYYIKSDKIPDKIANSLILVDKTFTGIPIKNNVILKTNADAKELFYQIVSNFFSEKSNGQISEFTIISPEAIIGKNVQIEAFSTIGKAVIQDDVIIKSNCHIYDNSIISKGVVIEPQSVIGAQGVAWTWNKNQTEKIKLPQLGGVKIGENCFLGANTIIVRGSLNEFTEIGQNSMLAPGSRIGHGTKIGNYVHFANGVITGGNTIIGDFSFIGSGVVFRPKVKLHENTIVGAGAVVVRNTSAPGLTLVGLPAKETITKETPSGLPPPKKNKEH
jgi:UDP-3-O-[3-hydroxymyristoyl] glucosamine N-acyltransferase